MSKKSLVQQRVKEFILEQFLEGEDSDALTESTPLMTAGILDSMATLKLVSFLENEFDVQILAHEADADHMDTLAAIADLVASKIKD